MAELGVDEDERWTNYKLLQIYDRLSLYFCQRDVETGASRTRSSPCRATTRAAT